MYTGLTISLVCKLSEMKICGAIVRVLSLLTLLSQLKRIFAKVKKQQGRNNSDKKSR